MTEELETVWNGTQGWGGGDRYLCLPPLEKPVKRVERVIPFETWEAPEPVKETRIWTNRKAEKVRMFAALATQRSWRTRELGKVCGLPYRVLHGMLYREQQKGTVRRLGYGVVALVVREAA